MKNRDTRYPRYCIWPKTFSQKDFGPENTQHVYPKLVLDCGRYLVPVDIAGQIRENICHITKNMFYDVLKTPKKQVKLQIYHVITYISL